MKKVIFIDDDVQVLAATRRCMGLHPGWEAVYTSDPDDVFRFLKTGQFQAVVSDYKMPFLDGDKLHGMIKEQYPEILRIIFTASHLEDFIALANVAHQIWSKPWDLGTVLNSIERTLGVKEFLANKRLEAHATRTNLLPSSPALLAELNSVIANKNASAEDMAAVIEKDPAMSSKVLQLVNSAFFSFSKRIHSIRDAVVRLGSTAIRNLVWSESIVKSFAKSTESSGVNLSELQTESFRTGMIARELFHDTVQKEAAFAGGLLRWVGQLVMADHSPELFYDARRHANESTAPLHTVERALSGTDHAGVGAYLLSLWGLPTDIVEAVGHQYTQRVVIERRLDVIDAVYIAAKIVDANDQGALIDPAWLTSLRVMPENVTKLRALSEQLQSVALVA